MLDAVKSFFSDKILNEPGEEASQRMVHRAAAALLLEVSRADFKIKDDELAVVAEALRDQFGFSDAETEELLALALQEADEHVSMHGFVRLINEHFSVEQKCAIIEDMWKVAYADRRLDKYEEHRIRKIADLLYVPHSDFIRTNLRVQEARE